MSGVAVEAAPAPVAAPALLNVRGLRVTSRLDGRAHTICRDVDLTLAPGETLGIVGESGSGKSMAARAIVGLLPAGLRAEGEVEYAGRSLLALREREWTAIRGSEIALIMQDPFTMLNPLMRCRDQICELLRDGDGRRLRRAGRREEAVRRLREVGITDPAVADVYPFELSGGMRQRVGIAAALAQDPKLVIADEPSTALDVTTQREILARLKELQRSRGMGLILITHDLRVAFSTCDRIMVLYAGSVLETAGAAQIEADPYHPYTLGLLLSEPPWDRRVEHLSAIAGSVADPDEVADRCAFADRCGWVAPPCTAERPRLVELGAARHTACIRRTEIAPSMRDTMAAASRRAHVSVSAAASLPNALVAVEGLCKTFGGEGGARRVAALDRVDLQIAENESVGLVGESGSGKTTLGRCLVGLARPSAGAITIAGIDASDYERLPRQELERLRRTIQIVFQDPYSTLNPVRTVGATLREALTVWDSRVRGLDAKLTDLLGRVGLPASYADRKPVALSGGERQRVAIARALAANPRVIVCDEAVSALDVSVQAQILNLLVAVQRDLGVSYLFISHDLAVVRQVTDRVYVLRRGEVVEAGPVDTVLDHPQHPYTQALIDSVPRSDDTWLAEVGRTTSELDQPDPDEHRTRAASAHEEVT